MNMKNILSIFFLSYSPWNFLKFSNVVESGPISKGQIGLIGNFIYLNKKKDIF